MLFERFAEPQHAGSVLAFELNEILRYHRDARLLARQPTRCERLQNRVVRFGRGKDLPALAVAPQVFAAGVEHDIHELVFGGLLARHEDLALALEHPRDAALLAHVPAVLRKGMADLADG